MSPDTHSRETIDLRTEGRTAWITLDRPPLNVLDTVMMKSLSRVLAHVLDPKAASCDFLVFQGAGAKAFSVGAEVADHAPDRIGSMLAAFHQVFRQLVRAECVTIAAVHGHCLGGGMELATFCDFVIATESAEFGQPEIKLGCFPPVAMITLPALIGPRAAMDLILTGRTIATPEALRLGLISQVTADKGLDAAVREFIASQRALSPTVLKLTARLLRRDWQSEFETELGKIEQVYLGQLMKMEDAREGVRAFLEKRPPAWRRR
ncbi:MAG TPA: enoyl-CoA hydratase/isomerase family protein [Candidatus Acidoferrales bacterium]|nr:enoyl-CoA hydratase/isomerase family protein [Candidatus Acidoferrales bacterium]